jgi:hypothetical protein
VNNDFIELAKKKIKIKIMILLNKRKEKTITKWSLGLAHLPWPRRRPTRE